MTPTLQSLLQTYFAAQNAHDTDRLLDCFATDATVHDEGEDIVGHAAIRAWKKKVSDKYHVTITPLRHWQEDGQDFVSANVEGTFPGSPIEFTYRFTLKDGVIAGLTVLA